MSPVCHNFVQNAWKKDFCSNCFKSRDEHVKQERPSDVKFLAASLHSKGALFKLTRTPPSILKLHTKKRNKRNVRFPEEVCSVIGFGGDDWPDDEEFQLSDDINDEDVFPDTEEEKELHRITKSNTDFNTVKANLLGDAAGKTYTSLMLGKKQTDSEGKKKTLMVSVTPFGQETNKNAMVKSHIRKPAVVNLPNASVEETSNNYKTNIILTSCLKETETIISSNIDNKTENNCVEKSLLEEISETLLQNRTNGDVAFNLMKSDCTKPTIIEEKIKEDTKIDESEKRDSNEIKKNSIVRNSPIPRNQERPKVNLTGRSDFKFCKVNGDNSSVDSAINTSAQSSFNSDDESIGGRTDSDNDDSGHFSETTKSDETVKIKVFNDNENKNILPQANKRKLDGRTNTIPTYTTFQNPILDMPPIIPKVPESDIFSVQASRELAGEPDGRADPDEPMEAPALPNSPVPTMDPRPSFLHGMIIDLQSTKPVVPEKPKLPIKPLSVIKQSPIKKCINQTPLIETHNIVLLKENKIDIDDISNTMSEEKNNEITEVQESSPEPIYYAKPVLIKQDSETSLNGFSKRKAPTPPSTPSADMEHQNLYQRHQHIFTKSDSPVVREKEKRERASPKNTKSFDDSQEPPKANDVIPEPAPRRNISLSHDNLLIEEKRKGKLKFSIKKLLRIGSSKDLDKKDLSVATISKLSTKSEEIYDLTPKPKPRLVIIHPLDMNGSTVEVVKSSSEVGASLRRLSHDDTSSIYSGNSSPNEIEILPKVTNKPPPPPRHADDNKNMNSTQRPVRPPPPKSEALQIKQKQQTWLAKPLKGNETNLYANLGEVRSALAPRKPERTASMREREAHLELPKRKSSINDEQDILDDSDHKELVEATNETVIHNYDDVYNSVKYDNDCNDEINSDSAKNSDSDYEYVSHAPSSSPECDAGIKDSDDSKHELRITYKVKDNPLRKSDVDHNSEFAKYNNGLFNRSSHQYCGSETESEIYSPYSFYSSTDTMESPGCNEDYNNELTSKATTNKLRIRKGRSIVHKNLEDNYGAVVIANHEALAQVLEQVQQSAVMLPSLRGLKACTNLRWSDFTIPPQINGKFVKCGKRIFYPALWNSNQGPVNVTLMLCKEQMSSQIVCQQSAQPQTLNLSAITEFTDLVPLQQFGEDSEDLVQATVVVLAHAQVDTIQTYGESLYNGECFNTKEYQLVQTEQIHEAIFMMLQLINGLKCLQGRGVEEITESLTSFVALRESQPITGTTSSNLPSADDRLPSLSAPKTNCYGRLCILQGLTEVVNCKSADDDHLTSLCKCAIRALNILLPAEKLTPLLKEVLQEERAVSLNQAKCVLEFMLWGPLDVVQGVPVAERELSLQRWLDLERATVLHGLVRTRVQLNVFEQLHLMFIVRSSAKAMCDASVLLEKANVY